MQYLASQKGKENELPAQLPQHLSFMLHFGEMYFLIIPTKCMLQNEMLKFPYHSLYFSPQLRSEISKIPILCTVRITTATASVTLCLEAEGAMIIYLKAGQLAKKGWVLTATGRLLAFQMQGCKYIGDYFHPCCHVIRNPGNNSE